MPLVAAEVLPKTEQVVRPAWTPKLPRQQSCCEYPASHTMLPLYLSLLWTASASATCYEPSEAHPLPKYDPNDVLLRNAFASIGRALDAVVSAPQYASTSFSVEVTSSVDTLWSHHHTALQRNASRPDAPIVNGDTLYRIASITKSFTVLGILYQHSAGNLSLDDPIEKYIGDLKGEQEGTLPWKDITLRSLASQLSGIPRDCSFTRFSKCYTYEGKRADFYASCSR